MYIWSLAHQLSLSQSLTLKFFIFLSTETESEHSKAQLYNIRVIYEAMFTKVKTC